MKTRILLLALLLTAPFAGAAPQASVLVHADTMRANGDQVTAAGRASAIVKGTDEEMRVRADHITFNPTTNSLECAGSVEVTLQGRKISAKELTIALRELPARMHTLQRDPRSSDQQPNKAPEPTP